MRYWVLAFAAACLLAPMNKADAATAEISLVQSSLSAGEVEFNVEITFTGDTPTDTLDNLQLSVIGSDPALTAGGADFSRFEFNPTFPGWVSLLPFDVLNNGIGLFGAFDPILGPFIEPSPLPQVAGVLRVDLSGIPEGTIVNVAITGDDPFLGGTDVSGTVNGVPVFSFTDPPNDLIVAQANGLNVTVPAGAAVPEPSSLLLASFAAGIVGFRRRRRAV